MNYTFRLPIGDWSNDGHGHVEWFWYKTNKDIKSLREAYFTAKKKLDQKFCPENIVSDYQEATIMKDFFDEIMTMFPALSTNEEIGYEITDYEVGLSPEFMAVYVLEFLKVGDPDLKFKIINPPDMLPFYGYDDQNRHIGFIGYGVTSWD